ncbi:MAG: ChbG/HpnK family deacetylase, partial [Bryobacterales bacterium]|nr:ChbG/HpnK family deacetylase [Bryobacterales bacterium]
MSTRERLLVVNADDFGFTRDVNDGIVEAHRNGILTATTLMANGAEFEHAVTLARRHPSLDVGCHLVLVGGHSRDVAGLVSAVLRGQLDVEAELDAQIRRILSVGLRPTHLDTHKHTHLHPRVLHAVGKLSHQYRIPWVRRPFDYPMHAGAVPLSRR